MAVPRTPTPNSLYLEGVGISRISLPEDETCICRCDRGHCYCAIRTGGDTLRGAVEVFAQSNKAFSIEVRLEGTLRLKLSNLMAYPVVQVCVEHGSEEMNLRALWKLRRSMFVRTNCFHAGC